MNNDKAIALLRRMQEPEAYEPQITAEAFEALGMAIRALEQADHIAEVSKMATHPEQVRTQMSSADCISRQAAIDALGGNEPVGDPSKMDDDDVVKMWERIRIINIINKLPSVQPEQHTCVNCGRTVNNGGWYADGGTRCPIEEHYALPKDGYCHLWEKRNVTDDDYPERRTDE